MATITGGELLIRTLIKAKVTTLFGLHGAHLETLFQSCLDHRIPILDTRHEVAAGHAAEGYARATRSLGVAMVTAGPGFTNIVTSIANAYLDRTPVLYLAGAAGLREAETNTLQSGIDQVAIATPITKWAHRISTPQQIPRLVGQAIRIATSGPTGPVLLELPSDVLNARLDEDSVAIPDPVLLDSPPAPRASDIERAITLLAEAERPVIMVGAGAYFSGAGAALRRLAELTGTPVYSDFQAHGLLPSDHPLYGGTNHKLADLKGEDGRPDLILALGLRFGLFTLGTSDVLVPHRARIIHVEIDPREIGKVRAVELGIVADPGEAISALSTAAVARTWPDRSAWQQRIRDAKTERQRRAAADLNRAEPPIHPLQAVQAIVDSLDAETIVIGDGAEAYHWMNEVIGQTRPGSYITHGFLGTVGMGLGLALGAQTACPGRKVLCLVGDGAVGFTITEFDTMVRHNLPIVAVVMNNHSWAASQHFQEMVSGANRVTATRLGSARYHDVAIGFGATGQEITRIEDLRPAIEAAFASGRPACINVHIDLAPIPPELHLLSAR